MKCKHCELDTPEVITCDHSGLCCDCYDLSWGMRLEALNDERVKKGRPLITQPWSVIEMGTMGTN